MEISAVFWPRGSDAPPSFAPASSPWTQASASIRPRHGFACPPLAQAVCKHVARRRAERKVLSNFSCRIMRRLRHPCTHTRVTVGRKAASLADQPCRWHRVPAMAWPSEDDPLRVRRSSRAARVLSPLLLALPTKRSSPDTQPVAANRAAVPRIARALACERAGEQPGLPMVRKSAMHCSSRSRCPCHRRMRMRAMWTWRTRTSSPTQPTARRSSGPLELGRPWVITRLSVSILSPGPRVLMRLMTIPRLVRAFRPSRPHSFWPRGTRSRPTMLTHPSSWVRPFSVALALSRPTAPLGTQRSSWRPAAIFPTQILPSESRHGTALPGQAGAGQPRPLA